MFRFFQWLGSLVAGILFRVPPAPITPGSAAPPAPSGWTLTTGVRYRMRLLVSGARPKASVAPGEIVAALQDRGFVAVVAYTDVAQLPSTWPEPGEASAIPPAWIAWAEGMWGPVTQSGVPDTFDFFRVVRTDRADAPAPARVAGEVGGVSSTTRPEVKFTTATPWAFYEGLHAIAQRHSWNGVALMMVMFSESRVNPAAWHKTPSGDPDQGASGLIQFLVLKNAAGDDTINVLRGVGWLRGAAEFRKLSADAQLPYVERYYAGWKLPANANPAQVYLVNYEPAKLVHGSDPRFVLDRAGEANYIANADAFDPPGPDGKRKGYIEVDDLRRRLETVCQGPTWGEHVARYKWVEGQGGGGGGASRFVAAAVAVGSCLAAAGGAWWWYAHVKGA